MTTKPCRLLTFSEKVGYNTHMARPRKFGRLLMNTDLRIPMTSEQKQVIDDATSDEPEGKAAWARAILIRAAQEKIAKRESDRAAVTPQGENQRTKK
jgi:hypothetical protein